MDLIADIVGDFGASNGLKVVLLIGLMFASFVVWRLSAIVRALNSVEKTARGEIRETTKTASENKGRLDVIQKIVLAEKTNEG